MRIKVGKLQLGQYVKQPGHCSNCIFKHNSFGFCLFDIKCQMFGSFSNCTSEDIFKL